MPANFPGVGLYNWALPVLIIVAAASGRAEDTGCPVTDPASSAVAVPWSERHHLEQDRIWYGSESLAVLLYPSGTWHGMGPDGNYGDKLWFWSADWDLATEFEPELSVTAHSVDDPSLTSKSGPATHGYSDYWEAMLTGLEFPEAGCWQVDASYRDASVSFVVLVE